MFSLNNFTTLRNKQLAVRATPDAYLLTWRHERLPGADDLILKPHSAQSSQLMISQPLLIKRINKFSTWPLHAHMCKNIHTLMSSRLSAALYNNDNIRESMFWYMAERGVSLDIYKLKMLYVVVTHENMYNRHKNTMSL